jgi:DNA-binding HxlR family transcriptional regulator
MANPPYLPVGCYFSLGSCFLLGLFFFFCHRILGNVSHDEKLCPTYLAAMDVLDKAWNGKIILVLEDGPLRFSALGDRIAGIGDRMLAARLKELEEKGLVLREVDPGPPVRVSYGLTDAGRGFRRVAEEMNKWGKQILAAQCPPKRRRA